jgi:hypothetical protein
MSAYMHAHNQSTHTHACIPGTPVHVPTHTLSSTGTHEYHMPVAMPGTTVTSATGRMSSQLQSQGPVASWERCVSGGVGVQLQGQQGTPLLSCSTL